MTRQYPESWAVSPWALVGVVAAVFVAAVTLASFAVAFPAERAVYEDDAIKCTEQLADGKWTIQCVDKGTGRQTCWYVRDSYKMTVPRGCYGGA